MSQINKRLEALESRVQVATGQPKKIIGTRLEVTTGEPQAITQDNMVTFYAASLREAFALREAWLAEQKNTIVLTSPFDTGDRVLEVLAEKHDRLDDCAGNHNPEVAMMTDDQLAAVIWKDIKHA